MGRPPLPVGAHGKIRRYPLASGGFRAKVTVRDADGVTPEVERTGRTGASAERASKETWTDRRTSTGGEVTGDTKPDDVTPGSMVFANSRGHALGRGSWRDPQNAGARLRDGLDRADYGWVTSHVFRKTAATILDQAGLSARAIAGHIGHARPSITQDVCMDKRSAGREAADAFEAALGPKSGGEKCR